MCRTPTSCSKGHAADPADGMRRRGQRGFSLVELMVAVVIFGLGLFTVVVDFVVLKFVRSLL